MRSTFAMVSGGSKNYWGNGTDGVLSTSGNVTLASTLDGDMVVKQYTSLTINNGHTLTVANRCKGLVIYVAGDCTINGTLSMTARGAAASAAAAGDSAGVAGLKFPRFTAAGTDVYATESTTALANAGAAIIGVEANQKRINENGTVYTIARYGGAVETILSNPGTNGVDSAGAGGTGGSWIAAGGLAGRGTCFSGGTGGGASGGSGLPGAVGAEDGGAGGFGSGEGSGGTGNPGGGSTSGSAGTNGTGGTIVLLVRGILTIGATGIIESKGSDGAASTIGGGAGGGGASGGGAILVLYSEGLSNSGAIVATGGVGGTTINGSATSGRNGGNGGIRTYQIKP